jgi:hypothetical protein
MRLLIPWKFLGQMVLLKAVTTKPRYSNVHAMVCVTSIISECESSSVIYKNRARAKAPTRFGNHSILV